MNGQVSETLSMMEFDPESIAQFDGTDGKPIYIVHQGRVFDVSESRMWKGGLHMKRHHAGKDLTTDIQAAPHGLEVLERYPQVGVVRQKAPAPASPGFLRKLVEKYPILRRHPHPMTVHFPIAFLLAAPLFNVLYLATGLGAFETTSFHCLAAGLLFTPIVMATGFLTWRINYMGRRLRPVDVKMAVSSLMFVVSLAAFLWRLERPHLADSFGTAGTVYLLLTLSLIPMVSVIGWYGAKLTFPVERG